MLALKGGVLLVLCGGSHAFVLPSMPQVQLSPVNYRQQLLPRNSFDVYKTVPDKRVTVRSDMAAVDFETIKPLLLTYASFVGVYLLVSLFFMRSNGGGNGNGGGNIFDFMAQNKKFNKDTINPEEVNVKFEDVAGIQYVKTEIQDILDFLKDPARFEKMGAKVPKGVLLTGPPGTGKTLIAKAIATEAQVPFYSSDGSKFVEIYIGVGSQRVRELFEKARKTAPCIVFIDEIEGLTGIRGKNPITNNDERENTLNALLVELDGFATNSTNPVIVIGATNRLDMIDKAVLRPGRIDRIIQVSLPDRKARLDILKVHSKNKPLSCNVDLNDIVAQTTGFSGADLGNIMNEASIIALRKNKNLIERDDLFEAVDKTTTGIPLPNKERSEQVNRLTAIHESGHAVTGILLNHNRVNRISIVPSSRGMGGFTSFIPHEDTIDSGIVSKTYLLNELMVLLAGRISEEITFGNELITTGASNDLERAKSLVKSYLTDYCMDDTNLFGYKFEDQVHIVIGEFYKKTYDLLNKNKELLELFADKLVEKKTLYTEDIELLMIHVEQLRN
jgi:cell division protease FtsH